MEIVCPASLTARENRRAVADHDVLGPATQQVKPAPTHFQLEAINPDPQVDLFARASDDAATCCCARGEEFGDPSLRIGCFERGCVTHGGIFADIGLQSVDVAEISHGKSPNLEILRGGFRPGKISMEIFPLPHW